MSGVEVSAGQLSEKLADPDFFVREEAVRQLAELGTAEAMAGLAMALEDENRGIRDFAAEKLVRIGSRSAAEHVARRLRSPEAQVRAVAGEVLAKIGSASLHFLEGALTDPRGDVRTTVLVALGRIGDRSVAVRVYPLLADPDPGVACAAADALGALGVEEAVDHLVEAMRVRPILRHRGIQALGKIGSRSAYPALRAFLTSSDRDCLSAAIEAAGLVKHRAAAVDLIPFLEHDDAAVARAAAKAIIRTVQAFGRETYHALPLNPLRRFLLDSLSSADPAEVRFALAELQHWRDVETIAALLELVTRGADISVRALAESFKAIGDPAISTLESSLHKASNEGKLRLLDLIAATGEGTLTPIVAPLANTASVFVRARVAATLGRLHSRAAIPALRRLAEDRNDRVRAAAIKSIGWIGTDDDIILFSHCLDDSAIDVRKAATGAMILNGSTQAINVFGNDLNHPDPDRQRNAAVALGIIGAEETKAPLVRAISHPNPEVRRAAIEALARIGHLQDTEPVRAALRDANSQVRRAAISALITLNGPHAVDDIRLLLSDADAWVVLHTIETIAALRDAKHARLIIPYLQHNEELIQIATVRALAAIGGPEQIDNLRPLTTAENQGLAAVAEEAIASLLERQHECISNPCS
jgi:HEAT repeat protein